MSLLFWVVAAVWIFVSLAQLHDIAGMRELPGDAPDDTPPPRVSVVIPARDEGDRLPGTVSRLLAQRGVDLELIVIDDRSSDGSGERLAQQMADEARLRIVRVDQLPDGWLGKPHACHLGAARATGDWLLFCDADVWIADDVVARAVAEARSEKADHLCLLPGEAEVTLIGQAALLNFAVGMMANASAVNRDRPWAFVGVGAFTLITRDAYRACGGHEALRFEVIEDMKLGYLVRRAGYRSRVYVTQAEVLVRWGGSVPALTAALQKNIFALFDYSAVKALAFGLALGALTLLPLVGAFSGTAGGWAAAAAMLLSVVPRTMIAVRAGWRPLAALLSPPLGIVGCWIVFNSVLATYRDGGVRWRETVYPLPALREASIPVLHHIFLRIPLPRPERPPDSGAV